MPPVRILTIATLALLGMVSPTAADAAGFAWDGGTDDYGFSSRVTSGTNGLIAFESNREGNFEIYTMAADGSGVTRLTTNTFEDIGATWSPDGTKIAFSSNRAENSTHEIYVMAADGSAQTRLTDNTSTDLDPAWSPDGTKIVFTSDRVDGSYELHTMAANGTGQTALTNSSFDARAPDWSPDGTQIAYWSDDPSNAEVFTVAANGLSAPVNRSNNGRFDAQPVWSPDGTQIAYMSFLSNGEIYTMAADGSSQINRSNHASDDSFPAWSPDGTQLAFQSTRDAGAFSYAIWTMAVDGSGVVRRTILTSQNQRPDWQRVGGSPTPPTDDTPPTTTTPTTTTTTTPPPAHQSNEPPETDVSPFKVMTSKFPNFIRKTKACGSKGYCKVLEIADVLRRRGVNASVTDKIADAKTLNRAAGREVEPGEVLETNFDGKTVSSGPDKVVAVVAEVFAPSKSKCDLERPFVTIAGKLVKFTKLLEGMDLDAAQRFLKQSKCKAADVEFDYRYVQNIVFPKVSSAKVVGKGKAQRLEVVVHHPQAGLQLQLSDSPKNPGLDGSYPLVPLYGDGNEIFLPAGKGVPHVRWSAQISTANDITFERAIVQLRDRSGEPLALETTNAQGAVSFYPRNPAKIGDRYEMFAHVTDRDGEGIVGFRMLRGLKVEKGRTYLGIDGRAYAWSGSKFGPATATAASSTKAQASAADEDRFTLSKGAVDLLTAVLDNPVFDQAERQQGFGGAIAKAKAALKRAVNASLVDGQERMFFENLARNGVKPVILAGSGGTRLALARPAVTRGTALTSDGSDVFLRPQWVVNIGSGTLALEVEGVTFLPGGGFSVSGAGGVAAGTPSTLVPLNVDNRAFDITFVRGAPVVGLANAFGLFGPNGGTPVSNGVPSLIGIDGSTFISENGGALLASSGLIGIDGSTLIGIDGSTLIGIDGSTLVGNDGSSMVAAGGMNLVAGSGVTPGG